VWRETINGLFTVKSAYHVAKKRELQMQAESSSRVEQNEMWGPLWKLPIPNAEKNFLWKACHEILPTKANLCRRKVTTDALCPICGLVTPRELVHLPALFHSKQDLGTSTP
jgi:hypothetical protein